jgi:YHS domain-containing protein
LIVARAPRAALTALAVLALVAAHAPAGQLPADPVICVVCGDYTFERKDAVSATYEGEKISLCNLRELDWIRENPNKYVWAQDPVSGARVNKIHTRFSADRMVSVKKKNGTVESWPRRFFFESEKTRAAFLQAPSRWLKEPYPG